jgi:uncharacterized protein
MLAPEIITDISTHAIRTAERHGFAYTGAITTNGYFLDRQSFRQCLDNGINDFQISFDGDRNLHDKSRVLGSGAGTFDRIWENVLGMRSVSAEFHVLLRLHYTRENYTEVGEFSRRVYREFGDDPRFRVFFKGIIPLGGPNDSDITVVTPREDAEMRRYLWQTSGYPLSKSERAPEYVCYAAMANSFVVRSTGRLGKCTVALTDDFNTIGELREDGEIVVDQEKFQRWIAPVIEERWDIVSCPVAWVAQDAKTGKAKEAA